MCYRNGFLGVILYLISASNVGAQEYLSWAVGDTNIHPPQPRLMCPAGSFIRSVVVRQDEWLAYVQIYCGPPSGTPPEVPGPAAGGDGGSGSHASMLTCPSRSFVDGITGLRTRVVRGNQIPNVIEFFAADPQFFCGTYSSPGAIVLNDIRFKRSRDNDHSVSYDEMNSLYPQPGLQERFHCPVGSAAKGLWYKLGGVQKDDIQTVGLICDALPPP